MKNKNILGYLFTLGLFFIIISPNFLTEGMFMDGINYAAVSRNLSKGLGTFWKPYYNELTPFYYGCPPLCFGIQSLFFRVLGDSFYVEKIFSVVNILVVILLIDKIWKLINNNTKKGWIPILLFVLIPLSTWAATNNILENSMTVFVLLALLFYIKSNSENRLLNLIFVSVSLFLGFLSKGFPVFFILTYPLLNWLFFKHQSFKRVLTDYVLIVIFLTIICGITVLIFENSIIWFKKYFEHQVLYSITSWKTVDSRFYILYKFLSNLSLPVGLLLLITLFSLIKNKGKIKIADKNVKLFFLFFSTSLTGVFPLMITLKQSVFYLLPVMPIVAISFAFLAVNLLENLSTSHAFYKISNILIIIICCISIGLNIYFCGKTTRDKNLLSDIHKVGNYVGNNKSISVNSEMMTYWSTIAYFTRYYNITLINFENMQLKYLIVNTNTKTNALDANYSKIELDLKMFEIYQKQ